MPNPETPGFLTAADGTPLHGIYHAPAGEAKGVCVIAPPLFEERKSAYGGLTLLARALAERGFGAFRFDFRGSGESGGDAGQRRWNHLVEDLKTAGDAARQLAKDVPVTLIGTRLGGTLALAHSSAVNAKAVVAIAPVLKGATEVRLWRLRSKMRAELSGKENEQTNAPSTTKGEILDLDGFPVAKSFFEDLKPVDLLGASQQAAIPTLVIQVSHREKASGEYERLQEQLGAPARLACIRALPFWERVDDADVSGIAECVLEFVTQLITDR